MSNELWGTVEPGRKSGQGDAIRRNPQRSREQECLCGNARGWSGRHRAGRMATNLSCPVRLGRRGMLVVRPAMHRLLVPALHDVRIPCGILDGGLRGSMPRRARGRDGDHRDQEAGQHKAKQVGHGTVRCRGLGANDSRFDLFPCQA